MNSSDTVASLSPNASVDDTELEMSTAHKIAFICLWGVGLVLNIGCVPLVGYVVWSKPTWPNLLLFVLTMTDAMVVTFGLSVSVASVVDNTILQEMSSLCTYQSIVINTWYLFSYIVVLAISMDRYLAVCYPFVYNKQMSNKKFMVKGMVVLFSALIVMLLIACVPLMIGADIVPVKPGLFCFFDWTSHKTQNKLVAIINVGITSLTVGVLLFFTVATCCGIYKIVQSARMRGGNLSFTQKATQSDNSMEVKFAKLMLVVIILFAACNLPFVVSLLSFAHCCYTFLQFFISCSTSILPDCDHCADVNRVPQFRCELHCAQCIASWH